MSQRPQLPLSLPLRQDPVYLLWRLINFRSSTLVQITAFEAFLALPRDERIEVWQRVPAATRVAVERDMVRLAEALQRFNQMQAVLPPTQLTALPPRPQRQRDCRPAESVWSLKSEDVGAIRVPMETPPPPAAAVEPAEVLSVGTETTSVMAEPEPEPAIETITVPAMEGSGVSDEADVALVENALEAAAQDPPPPPAPPAPRSKKVVVRKTNRPKPHVPPGTRKETSASTAARAAPDRSGNAQPELTPKSKPPLSRPPAPPPPKTFLAIQGKPGNFDEAGEQDMLSAERLMNVIRKTTDMGSLLSLATLSATVGNGQPADERAILRAFRTMGIAWRCKQPQPGTPKFEERVKFIQHVAGFRMQVNDMTFPSFINLLRSRNHASDSVDLLQL